MTYEEAKRILHPDTTLEALAEIEYYGGFNGGEAKVKACDEACLVACEALEKQIPKKPHKNRSEYFCPSCEDSPCVGKNHRDGHKTRDDFCFRCGQALDWSDAT